MTVTVTTLTIAAIPMPVWKKKTEREINQTWAMSARDTTARPSCVFGASVGFPSWINRLDRIGRYHWPKLKRKQLNGTNKTISLLEFELKVFFLYP